MLVLCLLLIGVTPILGTSIASITGLEIGVVIGKRYLLFPPGIFKELPLQIVKVRVGSLNNQKGGLQFDIEAYVLHPLHDLSIVSSRGRDKKGNQKKNKIALVIAKKDLPIGRNNVEQAILADANFPTEGPAYILHFPFPYVQNVSRTNITIKSKADCESTYAVIDCTRNLLAETLDTCDIDTGSLVFSGNTLIGTIATSELCKNGNKDLLINSIPYYEKWIRRTIKDEEMYVA